MTPGRCVLWLLVLIGACDPKTVAWECPNADCAPLVCDDAKQRRPDACDGGSCSAFDSRFDHDEQACEECGSRNIASGVPRGPQMQCACQHCAIQLMACRESAAFEHGGGDSARDNDCNAMIDCALANACSGTECYCGKGVDEVTCLANANKGRPLGPCAKTIIAAAHCPKGMNPGDCVLSQRLDPDTAIGRAIAVSNCTTGDPILKIGGACPFDEFPIE
jgi:hypothetical protein